MPEFFNVQDKSIHIVAKEELVGDADSRGPVIWKAWVMEHEGIHAYGKTKEEAIAAAKETAESLYEFIPSNKTTFYLITYSNDFDYQFLTEEEYWKERESTCDRIVCKGIEPITVANADAAAKWQAAYSRYIHAAWTPNQSREDRIENGQIISEAQATMQRIEAEVKVSV